MARRKRKRKPTVRSDHVAFHAALRERDDLGAVILGHIHLEHGLIELLEAVLPNPVHVRDWQGFERRLDVVCAMGLIDDGDGQALRAIGTLRNDMAHKMGTALTAERVNRVYSPLGPTHRWFLEKLYENNKKSSGDGSVKFSNASPRDKFTFVMVSLRAALDAAIVNAKGETNP